MHLFRVRSLVCLRPLRFAFRYFRQHTPHRRHGVHAEQRAYVRRRRQATGLHQPPHLPAVLATRCHTNLRRVLRRRRVRQQHLRPAGPPAQQVGRATPAAAPASILSCSPCPPTAPAPTPANWPDHLRQDYELRRNRPGVKKDILVGWESIPGESCISCSPTQEDCPMACIELLDYMYWACDGVTLVHEAAH